MTELPHGPHLVYFADPMCSWCWGFSPVVAAIELEFGNDLPIHPVMGGLRPYTKEPVSKVDKEAVRSHWEHVREPTSQPFDFAFFDRDSFVYDTEPSCRAIVVMRRSSAELALAGLRRSHTALYQENRDVTDTEELIAIAAATGCDRDEFRHSLASEDALRETRQDFALARKVGVRGFPTMLAGAGTEQGYKIITTGYRDASSVIPAIREWRAAVEQG